MCQWEDAMRMVAIALIGLAATGCDVLGPSCIARQDRGTGPTFTGAVEPGETVSLRVPYATEGSQNDLQIAWGGQDTTDGPRITAYATKIECEHFVPPGEGVCAPIGSRGGTASPTPGQPFVQRSLTVTHGRGNPEQLGPRAEYTVWIVGDATVRVSYAITVTWFYGPDC
jgi:hypothetical protein